MSAAKNERQYPARVVRVVDGDTVELLFDTGFYTHRREVVRLRAKRGCGVSCAETDSADPAARQRAAAAAQRVRELLPAGAPVSAWTQLAKDGDQRDGFRRYLARLTLPDGSDLGNLLLDEGLATPWTRAP